MKKKEPLETIALLYLLPDFLFDILFVLRPVLHVTLSPVVARAWSGSSCIGNGLSWLKDIFQLSTQDFLVYDSTLHINYDGPCFKVIDFRAGLEIYLALLSWVYISKKGGKGLIIDQRFVVKRVLPKSQVPKAEA